MLHAFAGAPGTEWPARLREVPTRSVGKLVASAPDALPSGEVVEHARGGDAVLGLSRDRSDADAGRASSIVLLVHSNMQRFADCSSKP